MVGAVLQVCIISCLVWSGATIVGSSVHCAIRREISPCTCQYLDMYMRPNIVIKVICEGMSSFEQVITAIQQKFENVDISLKISHSVLADLPESSFKELNLTIFKLQLNYDNLSRLPKKVFFGLSKLEYLSLADNALPEVPQCSLKLMPAVRTIDLGRGRIQSVKATDFHDLPKLKSVILHNNNISTIEMDAFPPTMVHLHLGKNQIQNLNGTLRSLENLEWLLIEDNKIVSLEDQFPETKPNLKLKALFASKNRLTKLPQILRNYLTLDVITLEHNRISNLDGALSNSRRLKSIKLTNNTISILADDEFSDLAILEDLQIGFNKIRSLNGSLLPLRSLKVLNATHNELIEFSLEELRGLTSLIKVDLSYNNIQQLSGKTENLVEVQTRVQELRLEYNKLVTLSGALTGLIGLKKLNISHNCIERILSDDLIGLDDLKILDISFNQLTTLSETFKAVVPSLEELVGSWNLVEGLEGDDFHGLPRLCWVDLSHNRIAYFSPNLGHNTQCQLHGVNSTLRIYLQGNEVMCLPSTTSAIKNMELRNTKIHGTMTCESTSEEEEIAAVPYTENKYLPRPECNNNKIRET